MNRKTNSELRDELPLIEQIDHVLLEYGIAKRFSYPYTDWIPLIAWETKTTIEQIERELEKMFVDPLNN